MAELLGRAFDAAGEVHVIADHGHPAGDAVTDAAADDRAAVDADADAQLFAVGFRGVVAQRAHCIEQGEAF